MEPSLWQLPDRRLRASAAWTALAGLIAVIVLASAMREVLSLGVLYPLKAGAPFAVSMLVAFGFLNGRHPFERFGPANQITTVRAMLVALVGGLVGESVSPQVAVAAVAAAATAMLLDGADGRLARTSHMASTFGARFDMEVDALLIMALALHAWRFDKAGPWVLLAGALRYAFLAAGRLVPWLRAPLPSSRRRQTICVVEVVGLVVIMLPGVTPPLSSLLAAGSLMALSYSFLADTFWLWLQRQAVPLLRPESL
jgi:phosphatidylglycerophosphate synthase